MIFELTEDLVFPPVNLAEKDGLLAVGGDLTVERLLLAYSKGIFPWYSAGDPILWWSPILVWFYFLMNFIVQGDLPGLCVGVNSRSLLIMILRRLEPGWMVT